MGHQDTPSDPLNRIWKFFASIRLTVVLLLTLAVTSIIGTVIPQNESPAAYVNAFGEALFQIFNTLDIFDMYHSWWFQMLLLLLTINVTVCSVDRLSATWKIIFVKTPKFTLSKFKKLRNRVEINESRPPDLVQKAAEKIVARDYRHRQLEQTENGFVIFAEKWRWSRLGVYIVHTSVIILLVGGLIGSIFGFEGFVNIPEGESVGSIRLRNDGGFVKLDFEIQCNDFNVSFYDNGMPKEFRSSLTIIEQGQQVLQKDIVVNDPLRYKGINIFQSSYGELPPEEQPVSESGEFTLAFTSKETGMVYNKKVRIGQEIDIPEGLGKFVATELKATYNFRGRELGTTLVGKLVKADGRQHEVILPLRFPSFDKMSAMIDPGRGDAIFISVIDAGSRINNATKRYYTGLQVTRDPGVWVVYTGFIMLLLGCMVTFFMSHQRICIEIQPAGKKSRVVVTGTANKNKMGMRRKVESIAEKLKLEES